MATEESAEMRFSPRMLRKDSIGRLLSEMANGRRLYVPYGGSFREWDGGPVDTGGHRALFGAKKIFFPPEETLFTFDSGGHVFDELYVRESALFGLRACDVRALNMMDRYLGENGEPFYHLSRRNSLIVGLTCSEPHETCFCTQFGGVFPHDLEYDLWLTEVDGGYVVDVGSTAGEMIAESLDMPLASEDALVRRDRVVMDVENKLEWEMISNGELASAMLDGTSHPVWDDVAKMCFACGKCNMICPTCHCYDVRDEAELDGSGRRVRVWDACHLFRYGMVAGGHNFRGERRARVQYRIYDKFYYPHERYGVFACTGCGRCAEICSAGIDLRDVLMALCGRSEA